MGSIRGWLRPSPGTVRGVMAALLATGIALNLAGCSSTLFSEIPSSVGGLPAGTPERPSTPAAAYPAVHDMPPPRSDSVLTDAEQKKIQSDLNAARDQQNKRSTAASADNQ
jgi:hypothetical protein